MQLPNTRNLTDHKFTANSVLIRPIEKHLIWSIHPYLFSVCITCSSQINITYSTQNSENYNILKCQHASRCIVNPCNLVLLNHDSVHWYFILIVTHILLHLMNIHYFSAVIGRITLATQPCLGTETDSVAHTDEEVLQMYPGLYWGQDLNPCPQTTKTILQLHLPFKFILFLLHFNSVILC